MNAHGLGARFLFVALAGLMSTGCASHRTLSARELFDWIQVGMSCAEVEATLGRPVLHFSTVVPPLVGENEAWYLPPPEIGPFESPWGPGAICVKYTIDAHVASKSLNPQWRESQEALTK